MSKRSVCGAVVLLVYLAGVGLLTGPSLYQLLAGSLPQPRLSLVPFADIAAVLRDPNAPGLGVAANLAGNVALLAPLGFALPLFWAWFARAGRTVGFCFGVSLSIELIQLVAGGVTSADDLLLNTLGAAIGYGAACMLLLLAPRLAPRRTGRAEWLVPLGCWVAVIAGCTLSDLAFMGGIS